MAIQRVSDIEGEPVVGKLYMVPCILMRERWWPIVGPEHDDADYIGVHARHYHRDARFTADELNLSITPVGYVNPPEQYTMAYVLRSDGIERGPQFKRMKCLRRMPDFPLELRQKGCEAEHFDWMDGLQDAYKDMSARCGRCPHRGFSLKGLPVKDGKVICNGHGLQFDASTGKMVPRC